MGKKEKSEEMEVEGGSLKAREFEGGVEQGKEIHFMLFLTPIEPQNLLQVQDSCQRQMSLECTQSFLFLFFLPW